MGSTRWIEQQVDGMTIPAEIVEAAWRRLYLHCDPCAEWEIGGRWFTAIEILGYPEDYMDDAD